MWSKFSYPSCSQPEGANDIVPGTFVWQCIPDNAVEFCDHRLNHDKEIWLIINWTGFRNNVRLEVPGHVTAGDAVGDVDVDVFVKFGNSRSNYSSVIRLSDSDGSQGHHI